MKLDLRHTISVIVLLFSMSFFSYGQGRCTESGYAPCGPNHECVPRNQCRGGPNPPPPGLVVPIDSNISLLIIAGLGLGIYFFVSSGRKAGVAE